jgi:hypothetical protein
MKLHWQFNRIQTLGLTAFIGLILVMNLMQPKSVLYWIGVPLASIAFAGFSVALLWLIAQKPDR